MKIEAILAFLGSAAVCLLIVLTQKWHGRFSMDSAQGVQKFHCTPTPRIGGLGIVCGMLLGLAVLMANPNKSNDLGILKIIMIAGIPAFAFGLLEDLTKRVSVRARLLATIGSGLLAWAISGISLTSIQVVGIDALLSVKVISVLFTAFAIGGVANAINIIDGFNGLAAGVVMIMMLAFGGVALQVGDTGLAAACVAVMSGVAGFFLINWPKGKIFLGDGGSYFLGFAVAWIAVLLPERNPSVSPWASLLICAYPIIEVGFSFYRKTVREGYHPSQPDGVHFHMLINRRWTKKLFPNLEPCLQNAMTSPFLWLYTAVLGGLAVVFYQHQGALIVFLLLGIGLYLLTYRKLSRFRWWA